MLTWTYTELPHVVCILLVPCMCVDVCVVCLGSENMAIEGVSGLKSVVEVLPFEIKKVCAIVRANARGGCSWKFSYSLRYR